MGFYIFMNGKKKLLLLDTERIGEGAGLEDTREREGLGNLKAKLEFARRPCHGRGWCEHCSMERWLEYLREEG